jgi:hypothetical protein
MPLKKTIERAKKDKRQGKSASTQAGEFVKEEIDIIRKGVHGARSTKQAIAIGLSKARRADVDLKPPAKGKTSEKTRRSAQQAYEKGQRHEPISRKRSIARVRALKKESTAVASPAALSKQAHSAAMKRSAAERSASARKAARTRERTSRTRTTKNMK